MNLLPVDPISVSHCCNLRSPCAKEKRIGWHDEWRIFIGQKKFNLAIHASVQPALVVGHLNLHLHRARLRIERAGSACNCPVEILTGKFLDENFRRQSFVNGRSISLRCININAERIALHDPKEWRASVSGASRDERANIDVSRGNLSAERRDDFLEAL